LTAAYAITFDNLGEVTALERGEFPAGEPLGRHFSVTRALPRILDLLDEMRLRATFFVEGLNTELYPDTLLQIAAAGHEVAYHGWSHEDWSALDHDEEAELLSRGVRALDDLGLRPLGFRPPGGGLTASTLRLLRELGFTYCSPAARTPPYGTGSRSSRSRGRWSTPTTTCPASPSCAARPSRDLLRSSRRSSTARSTPAGTRPSCSTRSSPSRRIASPSYGAISWPCERWSTVASCGARRTARSPPALVLLDRRTLWCPCSR